MLKELDPPASLGRELSALDLKKTPILGWEDGTRAILFFPGAARCPLRSGGALLPAILARAESILQNPKD